MKKSLMAILTTMVMSSMLIGAASASYMQEAKGKQECSI